ncbi:MAG: hypothetical protein HOW73_25200 [Polyangiaceae bacterium]|nr:hypothetical protein [Polyangiaceae bacterium]
MDAELYVRQILVDGIGDAGQRAICASDAPVAGHGFASEVARLYAVAAGFGSISDAPAPLDPGVGEGWVVDAAASEALAGARAALRAIHRAVENEERKP